MTNEQLELLREWLRAEIEYDREDHEEGADGYYKSAHRERDNVNKLFEKLKEALKV